jgi:hypothetical protein
MGEKESKKHEDKAKDYEQVLLLIYCRLRFGIRKIKSISNGSNQKKISANRNIRSTSKFLKIK